MYRPIVTFVFTLVLSLWLSFAAQAQQETTEAGWSAYRQGTSFLKQKKFDAAIEHLVEAVKADRENAEYRYALAVAYLDSNQFDDGWLQIRSAVALAPDNDIMARDFMSVWGYFDRKGLFNVGAPETAVLRLLGEPDHTVEDDVSPQYFYGFMAVNCREGKVYSILDLRDLPETGADPIEDFEWEIPVGVWKVGYRTINRNQFNTEYVPADETVQTWTKMFSDQRLLHAGTRMSALQFMANMRNQLVNIDKNIEFTVLQGNDSDVLFEWRAPGSKTTAPQHELVRVVQGKRDMHRIAYVQKGEKLNSETRKVWLDVLRSANFISLEEDAEVAQEEQVPTEEPTVAEEKLKLVSRQIVAYQIKLIEDGKVEDLRQFFTARVRDGFNREDVDRAHAELDQVTPEFLVHHVEISAGGNEAKITMQNGRTLTTLLKVEGRWSADTVWFK